MVANRLSGRSRRLTIGGSSAYIPNVLSPELAHRMESGMTLLVGTVGPGGRPFASRGWGIRVTDPAGGRIRVLVDAADAVTLGHLADGGRIAVTSADVRTFFSLQMKGRATALEEPTADDLAAADRWADAFFGAVASTDGYPRDRLEAWRPRRVVAVAVHVDHLFDQTPGPSAGNGLEVSPA